MRLFWIAAAAAVWAIAPAGAWAEAGDTPEEVCKADFQDGAVAACQKAVEANPDDTALRRHLVISLAFIGAHQRAIEAQREIVGMTPEEPAAHYDLAVLLGFIQQYPSAIEPIETALELSPDNVKYLSAAELIYTNAGDLEKAVEAAKRGAELGDRTAMYNLAWHYRDGKGALDADQDMAFAWLERAADEGHIGAMREMIEIYLNGGFGRDPDPEQAELWAEREREERDRL